MRKFTAVLVLTVALCAPGRGQEADQEIVSGFLGGSSLPPPTGDVAGAEQVSQTSTRGETTADHRSRKPGKSRRRNTAARKMVGPLPLPIRIDRPVTPVMPAPQPGGLATAFADAQWTHPAAIGAGLVPVVLAALLAGIRTIRRGSFARSSMSIPPGLREVPAAAIHPEAALEPAAPPATGSPETAMARRYGTGKGEIRLARNIGRMPDASIRRMQALAASPERSTGDTGIARDLRMGTGEVRLAMRLQQLSGSDNQRRAAQ
jgi:hypothetical protein